MRKITTVLAISVVTLAITLATVGLGVAVQDAQQPQITPEQFFELLRQDIEKDRVTLMGAAMGFNSEQAATFWPIYEEYQVEFKQLGDREVTVILDYARNYAGRDHRDALHAGGEPAQQPDPGAACLGDPADQVTVDGYRL